MIISLIGMSNVGKSHWSKKLEAMGFIRLSCDDYINEKLKENDISKWLGQPYENKHKKNSKIYLEVEKESLWEFIKSSKNKSENKNVVIDTTGSVIYTGNEILRELRRNTKVIYLSVPSSVRERMYQTYLKNPHPVLWFNAYKKQNGESNKKALKRCYPLFLEYRTKRYKKLAHLELDYFLLRKKGFTAEDFLKLIKRRDFI